VPSSGAIALEGAALASLTAAERARALAYVPQRAATLAGVAVRDVVAQARYAHRGRLRRVDPHDPAVESALELTELRSFERRSFDTLSGGEQRMVLLARALATGARILLFDEPTAGLDVAHVLRFFALAQRLKSEDRAVVCVLHDLGDVRRYADHALLLERGHTVAFGAADSVLSAEHIGRVYGVHTHEHAAVGFSLDGGWP
jgi:iron complex transport system ATP-binding protein